MHARHALRMRFDAFLTLAQPAPKLAPHRCSRACRAVKREAGRVLRQEIANLRCPRNGKRPRRMTQAGSGAFRVQVRTRARATARARGKASRSVASPDTGRCGKPAGLHDAWPAGKRGAQCSTRFHFDADPNRARSASSAPPRAARRGPRADCCGCRFVRSGADAGGRSARIDCAAHRRVSGRASHACSSIERAKGPRRRGAGRPGTAASTILRRLPAARRCAAKQTPPSAVSRDGIAALRFPVRASTTRSTRMTSLRMPITRGRATPMSGRAGDEPERRTSCTASCSA